VVPERKNLPPEAGFREGRCQEGRQEILNFPPAGTSGVD
jgi:hypothetical protein